jgi:Protein of unknown function (DUF3993)
VSSLRQKSLHCCLLLLIITFSFSQQAFAEELEGTSRKEVLTHVQNAFKAQVSLTEKTRTLEEIKQILSIYFEDDLIELYVESNVHKEGGKYIVYGTDFPMYTIPFFSYDENTKVYERDDERIIYEFFPASTDAPVVYDDHYEMIKMRKSKDGWKIYSIRNDLKQLEINEEQAIVEVQVNNQDEKQAIGLKKNDSFDMNQLKSIQSLDSTFIKQPFKEFNEVLFFNSFYFQLKNMLKEYSL